MNEPWVWPVPASRGCSNLHVSVVVPGQQMGAQTRQQCCVCQKEEGPGWVVEDKITNLTAEEHCQMTLASGKSGKVYVDRCQVSSRVELKPEPQPNKKRKKKAKVHRTNLLRYSDMFISLAKYADKQ